MDVTVVEHLVWIFSMLHNINPWSPPFLKLQKWGAVAAKGEKVGL